jgi:hypothetical protein
MPLRTTTRMSDPPADLGYQKPILDFGNALNLNVSDGVSAIGHEPPRLFSEQRWFKSRDEAEEFLVSNKP